jgi:hypothetical protein
MTADPGISRSIKISLGFAREKSMEVHVTQVEGVKFTIQARTHSHL